MLFRPPVYASWWGLWGWVLGSGCSLGSASMLCRTRGTEWGLWLCRMLCRTRGTLVGWQTMAARVTAGHWVRVRFRVRVRVRVRVTVRG